MKPTFQRAVGRCRRTATTLRHWELRSPVGYLTASVAAAAVTLLIVLAGAPLPLLCILAFFTLFPLLLLAKFTKPGTVSLLRHICLHPAYFFLLTTILFNATISVLSVFHAQHIAANVTSPQDGLPWREGLTARVWWERDPSQDMENGLADTAQALGFSYERVSSVRDANFQVWFDSWAYGCKWLTAYAFASLDPSPSTLGSQTGDIHLCAITTPLTGPRPTDYSIVAHEAAHIFAAQPHFGEGLMAQGGGNGAERFTEEEIETMRDKIRDFSTSTEPN